MCASSQTQRTELFLDLQRFLNTRQSPETCRFYKAKLTPFLTWLQGQGVTELEGTTPQLVRDFLAHLRPNHSLGGQHAYFRSIKAFLRWCQREYDLGDWQPLKNVDAPHLAQVPIRAAKLEDVKACLRVCDKRSYEGLRDSALLRFLVDTAVRASECLRLRRDDVDLATGDIRIRPETAKDRQGRVVFVGLKSLKVLRAYLRRRVDDCPSLWVSREGRPLHYDCLRVIDRPTIYQASPPGVCHP